MVINSPGLAGARSNTNGITLVSHVVPTRDHRSQAAQNGDRADALLSSPPPSGGVPTLGPPCPQGEAVAVRSQAASPRGPGHPREELSKLVNCAGVQHNPTPFPLSSNNNLHEPSLHQILVGQESSPTS